MGERLAGGNVAVALLANTIATGAALVALILTFGPISGAHFNPAVTLADASQGGLAWRDVPAYLAAQTVGAFAGVAAAHLMFGEPVLAESSGDARACDSSAVSFAVGAYITAANWFTASTSFANPAVALARAFTNTFSGNRPMDAPGFIVMQLIGAAAATVLFRWLTPHLSAEAKELVFHNSVQE